MYRFSKYRSLRNPSQNFDQEVMAFSWNIGSLTAPVAVLYCISDKFCQFPYYLLGQGACQVWPFDWAAAKGKSMAEPGELASSQCHSGYTVAAYVIGGSILDRNLESTK